MVSPKKKGNNDYINMTFQHATRCKLRLKKRKEEEKETENYP